MRSARSGASGARRPSSDVRRVVARYAPWLSGAVLVAGICAYVATRLVSGGAAAAPSDAPAAFSPQERAVVREFVATAVARKDLARAWTLSAPALREGMTLVQWKTGAIPVTPYPVGKAAARYSIQSSRTDRAVLEVSFVTPPASGVQGGDFELTLSRIGGRWLVSSWAPHSPVSPGG